MPILPKSPAIRQRRNRSSTRTLLPAESARRKRAPKLPKLPNGEEWNPLAKNFWEAIWSSPMSGEFLRADEPALLRLLYLINRFWNSGSLNAAKEIRMLEREFGLTPLARRYLEWTIAKSEEAKDLHEEKRIKRAQLIDVDPRSVLEEDQGKVSQN